MNRSLLAIITLIVFHATSYGQNWKELNDSLTYYYNKGDDTMAIKFAEKGVEQAKKEFGPTNKEYAASLNNLAVLYKSLGYYPKAEPLYVEVLKVCKEVLGQSHPDYAIVLNNLADLYVKMVNYDKAEPLYMEVLGIRKKVLGETHPDYVITLNSLASLYYILGEFRKAEPLLIQETEVTKKILGETHLSFAKSLNNLAALYYQMAEYDKAETLHLQALDIRKKIAGETHPDYAESLNNLAILYQTIGNYVKAESMYVAVLNILKNELGETNPNYATCLSNLAQLYVNTGNYEKAKSLHIEALKIRKEVIGENHPDYASSLNSLAIFFERLESYTDAEPLYIEALRIFKEVLGTNHPAYATNLSNLAVFYGKMGNYTKSESLHIEALNIRKEIMGENHPDYASSLNNLAGLYKSMGSYSKAALLEIKGTDISVNNILSNFSSLSEKEKEEWLYTELHQNESLLSLQYNYITLSDSSKRFILNQQLLLKSLVLADTKGALQAIQASMDSSLQKSYSDWINLKKQLSQQYSLPIAKRNTELANWEKQAENLEKQLNRLSSAFREQQQSLRIKTTDVQKGLENDEVSVEFVRFRLHKKKWTDSIIYAAYILNKIDSIPVFVPLFEEKQLQEILDSAGANATDLVHSIYRGLEVKNKPTGALGAKLYKLVWSPMEPHLKGIKKVSYAPAGKLYGIAFHALPVDSSTLLMDKYELQQYTSTRQVALRKVQESGEKIRGITLFGDAAFTMDSAAMAGSKIKSENATGMYAPPNRGNRGGNWTSLPGTGGEVRKIKLLFDKNKISTQTFVQTSASEENLKSLGGNSPQVLHIATHGFFLPEPDKKKKENPFSNENSYTLADDPLLRSGLILAGGNYAWSGKTPVEGVEDGIATAYEIAQLNLSNTELVVLSACETALGDVKGSEGVFGLQRAFKLAGVKKMIVSLWQVPDKETAELMTAFYGYWMKGKTIHESFKQAQSEMRKKYPPYYWAAFVLVE